MRYLIDHEPVGRGWISSRIRGGKEELIVEMLPPNVENNINDTAVSPQYITPEDSAKEWYARYKLAIESDSSSQFLSKKNDFAESFVIDTIEDFTKLLEYGKVTGLSGFDSDSFIASTYGAISDVLPHNDEVGCPFLACALALTNAAQTCAQERTKVEDIGITVDAIAQEVASESISQVIDKLPSTKALMARIAMLRALNRRARFSLPWIPLRPAQAGSAVLGGLSGFGASLERAGRTWDVKSKSTVRHCFERCYFITHYPN